MDESLKDSGAKENNTVLDLYKSSEVMAHCQGMVSGKMANASSGSKTVK